MKLTCKWVKGQKDDIVMEWAGDEVSMMKLPPRGRATESVYA